VLGVAAQQVGDHALEAALRDGGGRLDLRVVAAESGAVDPVEQQVALGRAERADGHGRVEIKVETIPSPVQAGQAPAGLLKEKKAMPISGSGAPQLGQAIVFPARRPRRHSPTRFAATSTPLLVI
jgi:hypothetical protein